MRNRASSGGERGVIGKGLMRFSLALVLCIVAQTYFVAPSIAREGPFVLEGEFLRGRDLASINQVDQDNLAILFPQAAMRSTSMQRLSAELLATGISRNKFMALASTFIPTKSVFFSSVFDSSKRLGTYLVVHYLEFNVGHCYAITGPRRRLFQAANVSDELSSKAYSQFRFCSKQLADAYFDYKDAVNIEKFLISKATPLNQSKSGKDSIDHWRSGANQNVELRPTLQNLIDSDSLKRITEEFSTVPVEMQKNENP